MSPIRTYEALPMRVVFGAGALAVLGAEVAVLGQERLLVLCSPEQEETGRQVCEALDDRAVGCLAEARMHVPLELADRARDLAVRLGAQGCIAVGGGSAIGLGKAVALAHGLTVVAVPTTYAGSEMTPVWGLTEAGRKRTGRDRKVLPRSVVYDPVLTLTLPVAMSVTSGVNAMAHAVEALYAPDAGPVVSAMAEAGLRALVTALPGIVADGGDLDARTDALRGAWLCGATLGATTMGLHHKLCHALGGALDLPHAATHTVVLPHVMAHNLPAAPPARDAVRRALGEVPDPARELWELTGRLGAPRSLHEVGMAEADVPRIVELVMAAPYANPRPVTAPEVETLLRAA